MDDQTSRTCSDALVTMSASQCGHLGKAPATTKGPQAVEGIAQLADQLKRGPIRQFEPVPQTRQTRRWDPLLSPFPFHTRGLGA